MRLVLVLVIAAALVTSACQSDSDAEPASAPPAAPAVSFGPAEGWDTLTKTIPVGEETSPTAWASTFNFQRADEAADFPNSTVKDLPSGEIVISALGPRPFTGEADFAQLSSEPLVIRPDACVSEAYDGQPQPHITMCSLDRWVGEGQVLNVLVWLGANGPGQTPSAALFEEANDELERLLVRDGPSVAP